jgi:hypothetical protein
MGFRTAAVREGQSGRQPALRDDVPVADDAKVFAAAQRIAERDRELLKRLAR